MALSSPGVEVTVIDQSQYLPAPTSSVPLVLLATAQNKANPNGTGVAEATTAANAGKLYQVTSQRDLVTLYGSPFFYTTTNGTPIQGYELNEYGLLAAYSLLGVTNRCYVLRADIDLASLVGQTGRPTGDPANGTYWLDTITSTWGIYEFNATTGTFDLQNPIVITSATDMTAGVPKSSIGNIGDYAVNAMPITASYVAQSQFFYKTTTNTWVAVGSRAWMGDWPTVQGTVSSPALTAGETFTLNLDGDFTVTITVPDDGGGVGSVNGVSTEINNLGYTYLSAAVRNGKLCIFEKYVEDVLTPAKFITLANGTGTPLDDMGITPGTYYQPKAFFGTSSQQPLWQSGQSQPRPTGSVFIKVGSAGNGLNPVMSSFNTGTQTWDVKNIVLADSDWDAIDALDPTGGQAIPEGTVYAQYQFDSQVPTAPVYFFERSATGPTVITGTNTNVDFSNLGPLSTGPYTFEIQVTIPGSTSLSSVYTFTVQEGDDATDFVTLWLAGGIPYTTATVTTDGAIQLTHTEGGDIIINDVYSSGAAIGKSCGALAEIGLVAGVTDNCKIGNTVSTFFDDVAQLSSSGAGTGVLLDVTSNNGSYVVDSTPAGGGSTYAVGDTITLAGATLGGTTPANNLVVKVATISGPGPTGSVASVTYVSGTPANVFNVIGSNWVAFDYTANEGAPVAAPANNTNWFYSVVNQVDIMVNFNGNWRGYRNQEYDSNGFPIPGGTPNTDPNGPIVSPTEPTTQSDGTSLEYGDLWINTTNLEDYPVISRWQAVDGSDQWVLIDNTDQINPNGIVFADARWATNGTTNPADDPIPTITSLLTSNYLDLDAPQSSIYPIGMMLFNTRRSGYNVKQYRVNYFNNSNFPGASLPVEKDAWVSASGLQSNGSPYMGRKAQRAMVVQAIRSAVDTNQAVRDEDNFFNLMAAPNYPELQPNMIVLNNDRGQTGYIIGDTPMGLENSATAIQAWATNAADAGSTGEAGLVTRDTYLGLFYPSGLATDLSGNEVAVPASHMMLRTFLRNDTLAYPWLAAAGTRRGLIDNALSIGYVNRQTGEFNAIKTSLGIRDTLYINFINPLVFFTGNGLLNYGNKTSFNSQSALDRTNVARLVAYIRRQLTLAARPFVFEPNDSFTRTQMTGVVTSLMLDLVAKRGIYDYLVVCDSSNNTPARIDRNELWVDVAIEPVKAVEFIYIPVRILNTGELASL